MNKIGFNRKQHSSKYYKFTNWIKNLKEEILKVLIPLALAIGVIVCMFYFLKPKAWAIAEGATQDISFSNFKGRIDCSGILVCSDTRLKGNLLNQQALHLNVYGEDFELKPGDLCIRYGYNPNNEKYAKNDRIISNSLIQFDMLDMNLDKLDIKKNFFLEKFNDLPSTYSLNIQGYKDYIPSTIYDKKFRIIFQGSLEVYIKGEKYKPDSHMFDMNFTNPNKDENASFEFNDFDNIQLIISPEKGKLLFTGTAGKSKFFFENGDLKFNWTTSEKQYTLNKKEFDIEPVNGNSLDVAYSMKRDKQLQVYGYTDNATLTGNSLFLTINQWLTENIATVVATVIATFLGVLIAKRK